MCFYGWPLPMFVTVHKWDPGADTHSEPLNVEQYLQLQWLPWTHQTYRFFEWSRSWRVLYAITDALFALVPLALILFLHPRRKPEPEDEK